MTPQSAAVTRAAELRPPPPPGAPYSVPIPGSEIKGRSAVYRHWRCKDELVHTLDPEVRGDSDDDKEDLVLTQICQISTAHEFFEQSGIQRWAYGRKQQLVLTAS